MKKSILTFFAAVAFMSCEKKETTNVDNSASIDSSSASSNDASAANDSTGVGDETSLGVALTERDKKFADDAAQSGMAEVILGELALSKGSSAWNTT